MKILSFADLHCSNYSAYARRLPNGLNSRFVDCLNILAHARKIVEEEKVDYVVFAGDLFESRTMLPVEVYSETIRAVRKLAESVGKDKFFLLVGNHDRWTRVGEIIAVEAFRDICTVVDKPETKQLDGTHAMSFIPHTDNPDDFRASAKSVGAADVLFMHQTFSEAIAGPTDRKIKTELSLGDIPEGKFKLLVSGDIHKRQFFPQYNFHYLGSPLQLDFGERDEEKSFSLIDLQTYQIRSIVTDAPKFYLYDAGDENPNKQFPGPADHARDFVRLKYREKFSDKISKLKDKYPNMEVELVKDQKKKKEQEDRESVLVMTDRELLTRFVKNDGAKSVMPDNFDIDECVEIGIEELSEITR